MQTRTQEMDVLKATMQHVKQEAWYTAQTGHASK